MARENAYQAKLIKKIKRLFPGCEIQKLDSGYQQGIPDLLILFNDRWAVLEVKRSAGEAEQPNQAYFINKFACMSFAAFIYPENEEEVLNDLQQALAPRGAPRVSQC